MSCLTKFDAFNFPEVYFQMKGEIMRAKQNTEMKNYQNKAFIIVGIFFLFLLFTNEVGSQQIEKPKGYPDRAIDIVVPMGAGGGSDVTARVLADIAGKMIKSPITVSNRPGASGQVGLNYLMSRPADGYTLLALFNDFVVHEAADPVTYPFTKQVDLVCRLNTAPATLQARYDDARFKNFADFVAYAKKNPKQVKIVGSGIGSIQHLIISQLVKAAKIEVTYIPSDASGERKSFLLGKHVDLMCEFLGATKPLLDNKDTKMLFVLNPERIPQYPDTPTAKELGYSSLTMMWRGLAAKKGTPPEIIGYLDKVFYQAMQTEEFDKYNKRDSCFNIYLNHEDFTKQIYKEVNEFTPIVEEIGLKEKIKK
jgi:tripartite-type tricarboxylate transporter receptor subunit TctC